jgi:hypothetical protein
MQRFKGNLITLLVGITALLAAGVVAALLLWPLLTVHH